MSLWLASTTAGKRLAHAVPDVVTTAAGAPVTAAMPRAKKAAERSSTCGWTVTSAWCARASRIGAERDPDPAQAWRSPCRTSSSTRVRAQRVVGFGAVMARR